MDINSKKKSSNTILIDISHPAKVHLFKHMYFYLIQHGYNVIFSTRNQKSIIELLDLYKIKYIVIGLKSDSIIKKFFDQFKYIIKLRNIISKYKVNLAIGSITLSLLHLYYKKFNLIMFDDDDDDVQPFMVHFAHPFCDTLLSPEALIGHRNKKDTIFYSGYHELAYLHPNRFTPDKNVLSEAGLKEGDKYFVLRFNSFKAHHDIGIKGISFESKKKLINTLKPHGKIFITTEREIEPEFEQYKIKIAPHKIHSFLYYSTMFVGDSQTMTSEAAMLGVPSLKCNSFAGKLSVPNEIENKYKLYFSFLPENYIQFLNKIEELLEMPNLKGEWQKRRERMLADKIDVTAFLVWFVENYPESKKIMKENSDYQYRFK